MPFSFKIPSCKQLVKGRYAGVRRSALTSRYHANVVGVQHVKAHRSEEVISELDQHEQFIARCNHAVDILAKSGLSQPPQLNPEARACTLFSLQCWRMRARVGGHGQICRIRDATASMIIFRQSEMGDMCFFFLLLASDALSLSHDFTISQFLLFPYTCMNI